MKKMEPSYQRLMVIVHGLSEQSIRSVYKELHADHETGAADNK